MKQKTAADILREKQPARNAPTQPPTRAHAPPPNRRRAEVPSVPSERRKGAPAVERYQDFPVQSLPPVVRELVSQGAAALGCDPAYVALPALAVCAAAVGNSRSIRLKESWCEPSVLWTAVVAESGAGKTPAYKLATDPLWAVQRAWHDQYLAEVKEYDRAGEEGSDGVRPVKRQAITSDVTIEKLAEVLEDNPRGVLVANDELAAWFGSFTRYRGKSGGSDVGNWLKLHGCGTISVQRRTGERRDIMVDHASASVTGTIQPGILARMLTQECHDSGLSARLLMAMPPRRAKRWTEATVSEEAARDYADLVGRLVGLAMRRDRGRLLPDRLALSAEAKALWVPWYDEWAAEQHAAEGERLAAYAKLEGGCARLALVHHVCVEAAGLEPATAPIRAESVRAGIELTVWFAREARRIYGMMRESDEQREARTLGEWIASREGGVTARDLQRRSGTRYPTTQAAEAALDALVVAGLAAWRQVRRGRDGGRPSVRCVVSDAPTEPTEP
jgi:hypothetical protein